ncbi:hypothetical protein ACYJ1Y_07600 [Natrialbaceae archaeon A-gly3]
MGTRERFPIPLALGAVVGAGAWIAGYLLAYLFAADELRENVGLQVFQFVLEVDDPTLVAWVFYNAHSVDVEFSGGGAGSVGYNFIATATGPLEVLYLLPPLALVAAGGVVTWRRRDRLQSATDALVGGMAVVVGYLPVSVLGIAVFAADVGGETVRPDPLGAVLFSGVVYPTILGAIGGLLVALVVARPTAE